MDPMDDPEARIRDLERPLAEQAKASELRASSSERAAGGYGYVPQDAPPQEPPSQWTDSMYPPPPVYGPSSSFDAAPASPPPSLPPPPPPPPPGAYGTMQPGVGFGTPFPPRQAKSRGFPIGWLLFGIFAVIGLAIAGGIYSVVSSVTSTIDSFQSSFPSYSPGTVAPGEQPTVSTGATVTVSGIEEQRDVACAGGAVTISGISNTVTITGNCSNVTVSGFENVVTIETSDVISASGANNRITYQSGTPRIENLGSQNVVEQG